MIYNLLQAHALQKRAGGETTHYYESNATPQITAETLYEYGEYGNLKKLLDNGNTATADDNAEVNLQYFSNLNRYITGIPNFSTRADL
ncbi:hypothetical protein FACS189434_13580 [Bacteroidia bacterium]|nr:hypothetical protein FACS189434_13580 [Bacteroidia bacterium]